MSRDTSMVVAILGAALAQATTNGEAWLAAMREAGSSSVEFLAAYTATYEVRVALYSMPHAKLIAEYGHLLPRGR